MRFCFIIEEQYKHEAMPGAVAEQLVRWGHHVDVLEPWSTIVSLTAASVEGYHIGMREYDAYVLKTVSDGPGLSLLEAAEAVGIPTINNSRAVRLVRDKAVATAFAHARGLPVPPTCFIAHLRLLEQVPRACYPLVIKPANGSSCRDIYRVDGPADLEKLARHVEARRGECGSSRSSEEDGMVGPSGCQSFFLAQRYVENTGYDIKLYVTGAEVYAVAKRSPLHPDVKVTKRMIPITPKLRALALHVGELFGLDVYGLDVVETAQGPVVVDINDFPSFGRVPGAVARVSKHILHVAGRMAGAGPRQELHLEDKPALLHVATLPGFEGMPAQEALLQRSLSQAF